MSECFINTKRYTFKKGSTVLQVLMETDKNYRQVLVVRKNNRLCDLHQKIKDGDKIETLSINTREGFRCYQNSLSFLLSAVVEEYFPQKRLIIEHSFGDGFYCKFSNGQKVSKKIIRELTRLMRKKIKERIPFVRIERTKKGIITYFKQKGKKEKVQLLGFEKGATIELYRFKDYIDFSFTPLVADSSYLQDFKLHFYNPGFVLRFPQPMMKHVNKNFPDEPKLFHIFEEYEKWGEILGVPNLISLNRKIEAGEISELIKVAEALHEKKIARIADEIKARWKKLRIVLIAGPSASGKTTFSKRLAVQLRVNCLRPITISLDDYFVERGKTPRLPDGTYDYESIGAIDVALLNKHLSLLLKGEKVTIPKFEFSTGKRLKGKTIAMKKGQVLIIEGIHGLNEKLTEQIAKEKKMKIYISALTQLNVDQNHRISTRDTRIVRRIVRDNLFRKHTARETFGIWKNVEKGEERNIFPFQEEADIMFNSALVYELSVLKRFAVPLLRSVTSDQEEFSEAERLLKFLSFFVDVSPGEVPPTSILREFIGGSSFLY